MLIIDASVAISWFLEEETSEKNRRLLSKVSTQQVFVPAVWPLEMGHALSRAKNRGRLTLSAYNTAIEVLRKLPITVDQMVQLYYLDRLSQLHQQYQLSFYDAAYVDLAIRRGNIMLATDDAQLRKAAVALTIPLWEG